MNLQSLNCVLDMPVFEWNQVLLHPELTPLWSFLFADGAHHKKLHSPTHPIGLVQDWSNSSILATELLQSSTKPTAS